MKTAKVLLRIGGALNALFVLFHIRLGWHIWHWAQTPAPLRALLELFNLGAALFVAYLAYASFFHATEMLTSRLGRSLGLLVVLLYGTRVLGEFVFQRRAQPAIIATCLVVAGVYVAALLASRHRPAATVATS